MANVFYRMEDWLGYTHDLQFPEGQEIRISREDGLGAETIKDLAVLGVAMVYASKGFYQDTKKRRTNQVNLPEAVPDWVLEAIHQALGLT